MPGPTHTTDPTQAWTAQIEALPMASFFSEKTWQALSAYLSSGPTAQRGHRVVEFLKALSWLSYEAITPNPFKQLAKADHDRLRKEITSYFTNKETVRTEARKKRESYKLKVFDYYKTRLSATEKRLLEQLREYELEKTSEDVNWRHYFWFTSFKQIDAFANQSQTEREDLIRAFGRDVAAREENAERLRNGTYGEYYWGESARDPLSFDDWLNLHQHDEDLISPKRRAPKTYANIPRHLVQAYRQLELDPSAQPDEVKQQFRRLTRQYHPDMPGGSEERMKLILAAYNTLKKVHAS